MSRSFETTIRDLFTERRDLTSGWKEIPPQELASWNDRLFQTDASLFQYPYWNEPFRRMYFSPRYLAYCLQDQFAAYVCILSLGVFGLRIGLVQRGPVSLIADTQIPLDALEDLKTWARREGYIFLRFTHSNSEFIAAISSLGLAERIDAFPFYRDLRDELVVEQVEDDMQMLAGFQQIARQEIKKASQAGYEFEASDSPEALVSVWPLFERLSKRKGFRYRPLASYLDLVRLARAHGCVRLYVASLGKRPVEAILLVRDRTTSSYMSGALDVKSLQGKPSPSCLLHWKAMRDLFRQGVKYYNLGTRSGVVYQFKRKFRPTEKDNPPPVTVVVNQAKYRLWSGLVLRATPLWPRIKRLAFR